jgi:radical SAM additional 4Fe4S-binding domain
MTWTVFETFKRYYLYDRFTNIASEIPYLDYDLFNNQNKIDFLTHKYRSVGLLNESRLKTIEHPTSSIVREYLDTMTSQVVLQVTQNCNLRCSYCAYTDGYYNRRHQNRKMDFETAKTAVDFLLEHSKGVPQVVVGFYGGEPLLEIELIKKVISYIEETYVGKIVNYAMTTNGTLLTDDTVDYLVSKKFALTISLDGPKELHDKHRIFENGEGSFEVIIKNVKRMFERHPDFSRNCRTNTVLTPDKDLKCTEDFLLLSDYLKQVGTSLSFLTDTGLDDNVIYDEEVLIAQRKNELNQMLATVGLVLLDEKSDMIGDYTKQMEKVWGVMSLGPINYEKGHPAGPCLVGSKRAFVDVDGNIYPCEKISETEEMRIGNIKKGFDIDKVRKMINIGQYTENECKECWAFSFCTLCVASMVDSKGVSKEKRLKKCDGTKKLAKETLRNSMMLKERGFDFYRFY